MLKGLKSKVTFVFTSACVKIVHFHLTSSGRWSK